MSRISFTLLAGSLTLLLVAPAFADQATRQQRVTDPYAGYTLHHRHAPSVERQARTVQRGAVIVERDRNRLITGRAAAQRAQAVRSNTPARDEARTQERETPASSARAHENPSYANSPHVYIRYSARHHAPRYHRHLYHDHHPRYVIAPRRAHVDRYPHPGLMHRHTLKPAHRYDYHRPSPALRLHTGFGIRYHGKHIGIHYHQGLIHHKFRHHRHYHHRHLHLHPKHCSSVRIHWRF